LYCIEQGRLFELFPVEQWFYVVYGMAAAASKLIVELPPRPHTLVDGGERERLAITIEARICNEVQLLQEPQRPERSGVGANFGVGSALFDRHYCRARTPDLMSQVLLTKLTADTGQANAGAQALKRLSWRIV
jgi:hypothetical protein